MVGVCRWVVASLGSKALTYFIENPHKTLALYDVVEKPKGAISLTGSSSFVFLPWCLSVCV